MPNPSDPTVTLTTCSWVMRLNEQTFEYYIQPGMHPADRLSRSYIAYLGEHPDMHYFHITAAVLTGKIINIRPATFEERLAYIQRR